MLLLKVFAQAARGAGSMTNLTLQWPFLDTACCREGHIQGCLVRIVLIIMPRIGYRSDHAKLEEDRASVPMFLTHFLSETPWTGMFGLDVVEG